MTLAVIDIGYGDAGKGSVTDRICSKGDVQIVVRFNGGCQAAHSVIANDGRHHIFAQFGSGTFQGVRTFLSRFMLVEPLSLMLEAEVLATRGVLNPHQLVDVDPEALVTTPYHWLVNRWREDRRGSNRHGSCGRGVGATAEYALEAGDDALRVGDLRSPATARYKLRLTRAWALNATAGQIELPAPGEVFDRYTPFIDNVLNRRYYMPLADHAEFGEVLFEGAQGVLLDEHVGFHPFTTWSTVTPNNARTLCREAGIDEPHVIGVTRTYSTRHGAGPFVPEDNSLNLPELHNKTEVYQGSWRVGHLDLPALRYAAEACGGLDSLYVTHMDTARNEPRLKVCVGYKNTELLRLPVTDFAGREAQARALFEDEPVLEDRPHDSWSLSIEELLDVPLFGISYGPVTRNGILFDFKKGNVECAR